MKKLTVVIFTLALLASCNQNRIDRNTELEESIHSLVEEQKVSEIKINSLTNFDWDQAFLFLPYTTEESIEEQLGVEFEDPSQIDSRDDIYLLVFMNDQQVVQYAEIDRLKSDFSVKTKLTPFNDSMNIEGN